MSYDVMIWNSLEVADAEGEDWDPADREWIPWYTYVANKSHAISLAKAAAEELHSPTKVVRRP